MISQERYEYSKYIDKTLKRLQGKYFSECDYAVAERFYKICKVANDLIDIGCDELNEFSNNRR